VRDSFLNGFKPPVLMVNLSLGPYYEAGGFYRKRYPAENIADHSIYPSISIDSTLQPIAVAEKRQRMLLCIAF